MSHAIRLTALEAGNPGAFLAALGVLDVVTAHGVDARLRWVRAAGWRAEVRGVETREDLIDLIHHDLNDDRGEEVFGFTYPRDSGKKKGEPIGDLKAEPAHLREHLLEPIALQSRQDKRDAADFCVALVAEGGLDNNGKSKPTAFHFTAGNQVFLEMVQELRRSIERSHVEEGLFGPWANPQKLPAMGWDVANSREYALRASDPSSDPKTCQPAVEWLGMRGLRFFPCFADKGRTVTTAVSGSWKHGQFLWPVWEGWLDTQTAGALLASELQGLTSSERRARGISDLFQAGIQRSDQGGYGSFRPPQVLV